MPTPDNRPVTRAELDTVLNAANGVLNAAFTAAIKELRDYIDERTRDMQTELLRGFRSYQESTNVRMLKLTADVSNIDTATDKRITIVEERLSELERKIAQRPN